MNQEEHFERLKSMYDAAPINSDCQPELQLSDGRAQVVLTVKPSHLQSAGSLHGSLFFKVLDEAASFAAYTLEPEHFMVTNSFTIYITRPITGGHIRAVGKVVNKSNSQCLAEAIAYDSNDNEVARGSGIFVKSKLPFTKAMGYA